MPVTSCSRKTVSAALPNTYHQLAVLRGTRMLGGLANRRRQLQPAVEPLADSWRSGAWRFSSRETRALPRRRQLAGLDRELAVLEPCTDTRTARAPAGPRRASRRGSTRRRGTDT